MKGGAPEGGGCIEHPRLYSVVAARERPTLAHRGAESNRRLLAAPRPRVPREVARLAARLEVLPEGVPRLRLYRPRDRLRGPLRHDPSPLLTAPGAEIENPVRPRHHVGVVLDHHHRVPAIHQAVEHVEELPHVLEMESRGRLVEQIEGPPRLHAPELRGDLHALGLATVAVRGRLTEMDVAERQAPQRPQLPPDLPDGS